MQYFTIISNIDYLTRALVLIESLQNVAHHFKIFVLCSDDKTSQFFEAHQNTYPEVCILRIEDLEQQDEQLRLSKNNRSQLEYFFTLSPCLPLYILKHHPVNHICSLDTDIKFYSSPQVLFNYLDEYSIVITPHKFSKNSTAFQKYGLYNVSFQIFKNDDTGRACLELWRTQCLDWCKDKLEPDEKRYADQKYLDHWETEFPGHVKALQDNVSGLAPWNLNNYKLTRVNNCFFSNDEPLIFYHFANHKFVNQYLATSGFNNYKVKYQRTLKDLYKDYWCSAETHRKNLQLGFDSLMRFQRDDNKLIAVIRERKIFIKPFSTQLIYISLPTMVVKFLRFLNRRFA